MPRSTYSILGHGHGQNESHPSGVSGVQALHPVSGACGICGSTSVEVDEVASPVRMRLCECLRCEHRWTQTLRPSKARVALRTVRSPHKDGSAEESAEVALAS